ncbi:MDR family MFS transporter [Paenibacillus pinihumi]|uniref:MDR family MFS transporter n=1 Tax=Paenibacillus pinihumi TaxID=669462 RepID=UPI003CCB8737
MLASSAHKQEKQSAFGSKSNRLIVLVMVLGVFVAILNETLLNVALTPIMADLGVSPNTAQWLSTGYLLVIAVLIPATAFLIQRFTTRGLFLTAMGLFTAGTLIAALASGFPPLFVGRIIQASGTALMFPLLTNVVFALVPMSKRGAAMGTIGIVITFAPAIGPTLSGFIVAHYNWRMLFYSVLPVAIFVILFAFFRLKNVSESNPTKLDPLSVILSAFGFGGIVYGFSSAGEGHGDWSSPGVLIPILVGGVALLWFVLRQLSLKQPMLDLRAFKSFTFSLSVIIMLIVMMAMFSTMMLVPIFLQNALHYSPLEAGLAMLPGGVVMGIMSPITGRLFDRFGARGLALVGLLLLSGGLVGFAFMTLSISYITIMLLNTLFMLGISMLMMPVMTNGLNGLKPALYPHGTAIVGTIQQVGGAVGMALLVTIMTTGAAQYASDAAATVAAADLPALSLAAGMRQAFLLALGLVAIALVLALFFLKRTQPESGGEMQQVHAH